jgi:ABC-2 type transport system permease protein
VTGELAKLPAFLRRDLLIALSYRVAFAGDLLQLGMQAVIFYFIGRLVDPATLPAYGGTRATYLEFVAIGLVLSVVVALMLERVATAIRQEQLMGTLECLLATPTATTTIQVGSAAFDLLWVPVRMAVFLLILVVGFGLDVNSAGILPALVLLLGFVPFVWGLGLAAAGAILTFRRGAGVTGLAVTVLGVAAGAYFPLSVLPGWLETAARANPLAIALDGMRATLLGDAGWGAIAHDLLILMPAAALALVAGAAAFQLALARERRNGTLGLY